MGDGADLALDGWDPFIDGGVETGYTCNGCGEDIGFCYCGYYQDMRFRSTRMVELLFLEVIHETEKAWLLSFTDGGSAWLPKSKCDLDKENKLVKIPAWLLSRKKRG